MRRREERGRRRDLQGGQWAGVGGTAQTTVYQLSLQPGLPSGRRTLTQEEAALPHFPLLHIRSVRCMSSPAASKARGSAALRCSAVLAKCEVKGREHPAQACCDRPRMCLVTSSYENTLETKTLIQRSSSTANTSACAKENIKRADSHRAQQ